MAGNLRCDLTSASPEDSSFMGSHHNGYKRKHLGATLDRSGSFREGSDSRISTAGGSTPRAGTLSAGDLLPLSQILLLDPIPMGDQKHSRTGELERALGISLRSEGNAFGASQSKLPTAVATEELRRVRGSIHDTYLKARLRTKRLNESLTRLNNYLHSPHVKRLQRNELTSERSSGPNFLKVRNPLDIGTQRLEDRTKNINKRVRSSMADLRVCSDSRSNTPARQSLVMGKEKDGGEEFDQAEEKTRMLPIGGEGWERKMKRKRSVGSVFTRTMDMEGDVKRVAFEPGLSSLNSQGLGSGSFDGAGNSNKSDRIASPVGSASRVITKNEREKVFLMKDVAAGTNKEQLTTKVNNKLNTVEDRHTVSSSPVTKGKASRAPRTGSLITGNTSNLPRTSGGVEGTEQTLSDSKVNPGGALNNRKRFMPAISASTMQWATQRQKTSRYRRANVVSPVSNNDELQLPLEVGSSTDFSSRGTFSGANEPHFPKHLANGSQQVRMRHENVSPVGLSESEESIAAEYGDGRSKDRGNGNDDIDERSLNQNLGPSMLPKKKNKILHKEDIVDVVRRQGRTGRVASSARATVEIPKVKSENITPGKPHRNSRPGSDKNESRSGRPPLKKSSDCKAIARLSQITGGCSPDFAGESDDDREDLLEAAKFACNASYLSSSGSFWKKMEPLFGRICLEDLCFLNQELKSIEEIENLHEELGQCKDSLVDVHRDSPCYFHYEERGNRLQDHVHSTKLGSTLDYEDQDKDDGNLHANLGGKNKITSLYQRVLSALIVEEEFEEADGGSCTSSQVLRGGSPGVSFQPIDGYACNGRKIANGFMGTCNQLCNGDLLEESCQSRYLNNGILHGCLESSNIPVARISSPGISALDSQYMQMYLEEKILMELQSIGINPESMPDLDDGEEEPIAQDISELQNGLHRQVAKKKPCLSKIQDEIEKRKETEGWAIELAAMDKLVEFAYRKLLATKGSYASKNKVPKVSKQAAIGFIKRTLHKCRKFEDTDKSCFSEPELRDILFATPPRGNNPQSLNCIVTEATGNVYPGTPNSQQESGSFVGRAEDVQNGVFNRGGPDAFGASNRGKKKEVLLDEVGGNSSSMTAMALGNMPLGGATGKRSERERDNGTVGRNTIVKGGCASQTNTKGDRKAKSNLRLKTGQLSTSGDVNAGNFRETNTDRKTGVESMSHCPNPRPSTNESKEVTDNTELQELENFQLDDGNQDLHELDEGWFNFEVDALLPENEMDGLDIPMDDLSDLNMLM